MDRIRPPALIAFELSCYFAPMKAWSLTLGIGLFVMTAHATPAAPGEETLLLAAQASLLREAFHQSVAENSPISETVQGTLMRGTALTEGNVTAFSYPSVDGIGITLALTSSTNACTINTNIPRPDIFVNFDWTIFTRATTYKPLLLKEQGFALYPARSSAASSITINGLSTGATGLLWRLKERVAERKAWEKLLDTKAENESQAARRIETELSTMMDKRTYESLLPIHNRYLEYVYTPLVKGGLLGGRIGMASDAAWVALRGTAGENPARFSVGEIPELDAAAPILMRLHEGLLERLARMRLGGAAMTDVEAAEVAGRYETREDSVEGILGDGREEVLSIFDEERPIDVSFDDDRIKLVLRYQSMETLGKRLEKVKLTREIRISRADGTIYLHAEPPRGISFYDDTPLPRELAAHVMERLARLIPKEAVNLSAKTLFEGVKPMKVRALKASRGRLTLGLAPVPKGDKP